jgi:hypothetical protein
VIADLAALCWPAVAAYAIWRLAPVAEQFAPRAARAVVEEAPAEVPDDLVALALQQSETWAQEDTVKAMREKYELAKDWNLVRSAFGVGRVTT